MSFTALDFSQWWKIISLQSVLMLTVMALIAIVLKWRAALPFNTQGSR